MDREKRFPEVVLTIDELRSEFRRAFEAHDKKTVYRVLTTELRRLWWYENEVTVGGHSTSVSEREAYGVFPCDAYHSMLDAVSFAAFDGWLEIESESEALAIMRCEELKNFFVSYGDGLSIDAEENREEYNRMEALFMEEMAPRMYMIALLLKRFCS